MSQSELKPILMTRIHNNDHSFYIDFANNLFIVRYGSHDAVIPPNNSQTCARLFNDLE